MSPDEIIALLARLDERSIHHSEKLEDISADLGAVRSALSRLQIRIAIISTLLGIGGGAVANQLF
jgi:hypothetical protein